MPAMEDDARGEEDLDAGRHCCTRGALVAEEEELEGEEPLGRGRRRRNRRRKKKLCLTEEIFKQKAFSLKNFNLLILL